MGGDMGGGALPSDQRAGGDFKWHGEWYGHRGRRAGSRVTETVKGWDRRYLGVPSL